MPLITLSSLVEAGKLLKQGSTAVVVVHIGGAHDDVVACLDALVRHAEASTDILLVVGASPDSQIDALAAKLHDARQRVVLLKLPESRDLVQSANDGFRAAGRRDVVLMDSDVVVGPHALDHLREAAYSDSRVATATPLTNDGSIVSIPERNTPAELPGGWTPEDAAVSVAASSVRLRPDLPTSLGHCTYIKRMAIDLVGGLDEAFSPAYGEAVVDFGNRCTLLGLAHVCADDVFVHHRGRVAQQSDRHHQILVERYPFHDARVRSAATGEHTPLALALGEARRALHGLTIAIDATCLGPLATGTQRGVTETILALARHAAVDKLVVVMPDRPPGGLVEHLGKQAKLEIVRVSEVTGRIADVIYRPVHVYEAADIGRLRAWADRVVVAQLDLIAFNNPGYFRNWQDWAGYRDTVRLGLAIADGVAFVSEHSRQECRASGLLAQGQPTAVVFNGTDHVTVASAGSRPENLADEVTTRGFLLCLGTDYVHKNRLFAVRLFAAMVERGYTGHLVLAGEPMPYGSSRASEEVFLREHDTVAARVVSLGSVSEAARTWLIGHASLVLHPTLYEGFGLVPFEAALAGTPCLTSAQTALAELLPPDAEVMRGWDASEVADQAMTILAEPQRRNRLVDALARRAREYTWAGAADRLLELFGQACRSSPIPLVVAIEGEGGSETRASRIARLLSILGLDQEGRFGLQQTLATMYPREFHEAMRAIGQRAFLRRPLMGLLRVGYRLASSVRSRRGK